MTADQFWKDDPRLVGAFREADLYRRQKQSNDQWMQGLYIYHAFSVVLGNAFKKKGTSSDKYMAEPIRVIPETEQEKAERAEKEKEKLINYLNKWANQSMEAPK